MTQKEFELKLKIIKARARIIVMQQAPVRSGHLMNSIQVIMNNNGITIVIDPSDVPYAFDTTRVWDAKRASGRQNPNEGWWDQAAQAVANMVIGVLGPTAVIKNRVR